MASEIDVYRQWLGVTETARPLNHYQLLRLKAFEDDQGKVREHYRKMSAHVRKFAAGEYAQQAHDLLGELAKAMLCLTDAVRKEEYDASLGRQTTGGPRRRSFEEILLANKGVDQAQLAKARSYAQAVGLDVREALVQQKALSPESMMLAYAESVGLPFIDLEDVGVDEALAPAVPPTLARQHSCVPVLADKGHLLMASPNLLPPDVEEELRLRFSMPVRTVLCTPAGVNAAVAKYYPRDAMAPAVVMKKGAKPAKAAKKAAADDDEEPPAPAGPLTAEDRKDLYMKCFVAFNLTVMIFGVSRAYFKTTAWTSDVVDFDRAGIGGAWGNCRRRNLRGALEEGAGMTPRHAGRGGPRGAPSDVSSSLRAQILPPGGH